uniref:G-protein coupled receptors family 3 profile domain-containing protein n=1 Tax=Xenopus tropicalis TaxID=8364 RepID=A0A1B8Y3M6_XENTR
MDFQFAVEQTNKDPARLPNLTLGYHIYDSCQSQPKAVKSVLQILSGTREPVPNYSCVGKRNIAGFIGDLTSETTVPIAQILTLYGYSQLHLYLKKVQYRSELGQTFSFDDNREYVTKYLIHSNFMASHEKVIKYSLGEFLPWAPLDQQLNVTPTSVPWKTKDNKIPRAQCSDSCFPGYRKMPIPRAQSCCYVCAPCAEGEISNKTDSVSCTRCPDMEWPNEKKNQCIGRKEEFLSYTKDLISLFISLVSVLFGLKTQLILGVFISYRDSPIVRANNRSLSFLLLVSIKLSFLSVFLFLGRPVDITCMLRNVTFGITFSIAVSSLLAKTIMVCVAFKATKPGSSWRKWLGVKLSNSVVLFCSSIQIIICMTWLAISPPFQELDIHTSPGTIIIQCNEGSAIGFYSVIGYMGLLAAVSFVLAFLARSLPDSFNEAKYITFSMLLFCSVWITMIPAYLSTKGKNTVCVEIFAILTSSAGLLACIFLPKCYNILLKPEMNKKTNLLYKTQ